MNLFRRILALVCAMTLALCALPALGEGMYYGSHPAPDVYMTQTVKHTCTLIAATMMLRNGAKIENVSRMLGHTNIRQTMRYAKVLAESVMDDFELLEQALTKKGKA